MIDKRLGEQIAFIVEDCGYKLWHCEYLHQGKHSVFRIFIDHDNEVGLDACGFISRQVSAFLDVEDPFSDTYRLEVSTPGLPKTLYSKGHYQRYIGRNVDVKLRQPINRQRKIRGVIEAVDNNENLILKLDDGMLSIALSNIVKAKLTD